MLFPVIHEKCLCFPSFLNPFIIATGTFKKAVLLNYDPVNMNDKFAEVMLDNLKHRDCHFLVSLRVILHEMSWLSLL